MKPIPRPVKVAIGAAIVLAGFILYEIYMPPAWRYRDEIKRVMKEVDAIEAFHASNQRYPTEAEWRAMPAFDLDDSYRNEPGWIKAGFTPNGESYCEYDLVKKTWDFSSCDE